MNSYKIIIGHCIKTNKFIDKSLSLLLTISIKMNVSKVVRNQLIMSSLWLLKTNRNLSHLSEIFQLKIIQVARKKIHRRIKYNKMTFKHNTLNFQEISKYSNIGMKVTLPISKPKLNNC